MSNKYHIKQVATSYAIQPYDDILDSVAPGLTHDMPAFEDQSVKTGFEFLLLATVAPVDLQTVDASIFFESGVNTLTVTDVGLHKFKYVEGQWYRIYFGAAPGGGLTEILDNADLTYTANPNNGSPPVTWDVNVPVLNTIFVSKNGNDATAEPWNLKLPYLTLEAAHAASTPNDTVVVFPGKYTMTGSLLFDGNFARKIYLFPGVLITSLAVDYTFKISGQETMQILGYGDFNIKFPLFNNVDFVTDIAFFEWEFNKVVNDSFGTNFQGTDLTSLKGSIRGRSILDVYFDATSWNQIDMQLDEWIVDQSSMLQFDDPNDNNGTTYIATYGPATFKLSGFSKPRVDLKKPTVSVGAQAFITIAFGGSKFERLMDFDADFYTMDGPAIAQGGGTIRWRGNGYHMKSNTLGNEMPFYTCYTVFSGDNLKKPHFEHWGTVVTKSSEAFPYLNNTLFDIRQSGDFILHGVYKNSGQDELSLGTPFPVVQVLSGDTDGTCRPVFDGVFVNDRVADTGVIKLEEIGAGALLKPTFMTCLAICAGTEKPVGPIFTTSGPIRIFVYHSLGLNAAIDDTNIVNIMSVDRHYVDSDIQYPVPEYQL